jgi:hypothetical protein
MQIRIRQLGGEPSVHNRSVVKISYNIKMTEEVLLGYVPSSPTMIYSIIQIYMKPSHCSRLKYKYYIIHDEVQKGESGSPIYISPLMSRQQIS